MCGSIIPLKSKLYYDEMTDKEQKKKKIMIASGTTVFLAGLITALLTGKKK